MHLGDEKHHEDRAMQRLGQTLIDAETLDQRAVHVVRCNKDHAAELVGALFEFARQRFGTALHEGTVPVS